MAFFKPKTLIIIFLCLASSLPVFAIDEATRSRLEELLEKAKARKSGKKLSTRDLAKDKAPEKETVKTNPYQPAQQPVININQKTEINGSENYEPKKRSYEDILEEYRLRREAQKEEAVSTPVIKEPEVVQPKVLQPVITKPVVTQPTLVTPIQKPTEPKTIIPVSPKVENHAPAVEVIKPSRPQVKIETKNEVKQGALKEIALPGNGGGTSKTSNSDIQIEEKHEASVLDETRAVTPAPSGTQTVADREAEYQLVMRKSLKSLEEDAWNEVKYNMGEAKDYFAREKAAYPDDKNIDIDYKMIIAFQRFSEAGLELDEGDFADFEEAEALYLDAYDILDETEKMLGEDLNSRNMKEMINTVRKYIDEDLEYIEEMIGID